MAGNSPITTKVLNNRGGKGQLKLTKLSAAFKTGVQGAVYATAIDIQTGAKKKLTDWPAVDTGRLRSSLQIDVANDALSAKVTTNVEYAGYVEFGTRKMKARPYLFPAAEEAKAKFRARVKKAYEAAKDAGEIK
jgi:HK97 gp10 family phage protein